MGIIFGVGIRDSGRRFIYGIRDSRFGTPIYLGIRDSRFGTPIVWGFGTRDSGCRLFGDSGFGIRDADYLRGRGLAVASPPINCESTD